MTVKLKKKFDAYHRDNPKIYKAFKKFTLMVIHREWRHYGAKSIMERVRWHTSESGQDDFKINNNYTAYYVRIFETEFPQHVGFFRKRCI